MGSPDALSGLTSYRPQPRMLVATSQKELLRERHVLRVSADRADVAELEPAREHHAIAERQVMAPVGRHRVIFERAGQEEVSRLLAVQRHLVAVVRVQDGVRGAPLQVEAERTQRGVLLSRRRVEAERNQFVAQRGIVEHIIGDGADVVLACHRHGPGRVEVRAVRQRRLGADRHRSVRRREGVPALRVAGE